jgi:hypothetical protein
LIFPNKEAFPIAFVINPLPLIQITIVVNHSPIPIC